MRVWVVVGMMSLAGCGDPMIGKAKEAVAARMKDPVSAKFTDVRKCKSGDYVTGKVNAKNSFGAYAGAEQFISNGYVVHTASEIQTFEDAANVPLGDRLMPQLLRYCDGEGPEIDDVTYMADLADKLDQD